MPWSERHPAIYQATASDLNGDAVTYSITGGADAARFAMAASGQLSFVTPPNFDLPTDADANNVYDIRISASDGRASVDLPLSVAVTNSKESTAVRRVASGFVNPTAISPISDSAVLVAEKAGAIYLLDPQSGTKSLIFQVPNVGTVGVTAIAGFPDAAATSSIVVMYTTQTGALVVSAFNLDPNLGSPFNVTGIFGEAALNYAGGGWLGYDRDGTLLIATGDAGGVGDPGGSARDDTSRFGKLLRRVRNPDPYAGASVQFFLIRTIAKGFHQPNGGTLFGDRILLADRGQDVAEELNLIASNATVGNFGWPFKEGTRTVAGNGLAGLIDPVLEYFRSGGLRTGQAIVGGTVGPVAIASLRNQYVFADGSGAILAMDSVLISAGTTRSSNAVERRDADFAPDLGTIDRPVAITSRPGEAIFIVDADGEVFRVDGVKPR